MNFILEQLSFYFTSNYSIQCSRYVANISMCKCCLLIYYNQASLKCKYLQLRTQISIQVTCSTAQIIIRQAEPEA